MKSKTIDDLKLELTIPNDWQYKEMPKNQENDFYKYNLKLYKNNEEQYAIYSTLSVSLKHIFSSYPLIAIKKNSSIKKTFTNCINVNKSIAKDEQYIDLCFYS